MWFLSRCDSDRSLQRRRRRRFKISLGTVVRHSCSAQSCCRSRWNSTSTERFARRRVHGKKMKKCLLNSRHVGDLIEKRCLKYRRQQVAHAISVTSLARCRNLAERSMNCRFSESFIEMTIATLSRNILSEHVDRLGPLSDQSIT